jgi:hypothetical protein
MRSHTGNYGTEISALSKIVKTVFFGTPGFRKGTEVFQ